MTKKKAPRRNTERFQKALLAERERLRERLRNLDADDETADGSVQDSIDVASDASIRDTLRGITMNEAEQLKRVETALGKIEAGTYGDCDACGKSIESERLEALPFATTCIACKRDQERKSSRGD